MRPPGLGSHLPASDSRFRGRAAVLGAVTAAARREGRGQPGRQPAAPRLAGAPQSQGGPGEKNTEKAYNTERAA